MKKYLAFGLLSSLLLTSCSIDWNDEKEKTIGELGKQISEMKKENQNDLFKKKQECAKYKDDMLKFANYYQWKVDFISEIFYSPLEESCYFIARTMNWNEYLYDYFSQSGYIEWSWTINCDLNWNKILNCNPNEQINKVATKTKELKWE